MGRRRQRMNRRRDKESRLVSCRGPDHPLVRSNAAFTCAERERGNPSVQRWGVRVERVVGPRVRLHILGECRNRGAVFGMTVMVTFLDLLAFMSWTVPAFPLCVRAITLQMGPSFSFD